MILSIHSIKWPDKSTNPTTNLEVEIPDELVATPGEFRADLAAKIYLVAGGTPISYSISQVERKAS